MEIGKIAGTFCATRSAKANIWYASSLTLFLAIVTVFAVFPSLATAQDFRFNTVVVEGNQRIQTGTIVTQAGIAPGQSISAGELNDASQRIRESGLFERVELDPRGSTLVIRVVEFPTINRINFEGNRRIDDEALATFISSAPRRVFNPSVAERDAATIAEAYSQQGRIAANVTPRIIRRSENRVDLIFEIAEGDTTEVERVSFVGNRVYSDRRLRRVLETKQAGILRAFVRSDTFIEDRIEFDKQVLRDFYLSRGYVDFRTLSANAELTRERDGFFVVFNVQEGQQFKFGQITTVSEIPEADADEFQDALRIRPGVVYSPMLVDNSIARQERLAIQQGIDFLRVEPRITRNDRDLTLDVEFVLTRGPRVFVERIDIEGNTTTLDRVVRRQFRIVEGDPFNPREIRESAERIRALGFFSNADVEAREGSAPDQVIIDVDVEEQPTGQLNIGGSYSVNDGFGVLLGLRENNFLGRGQRFEFNWSGAEDSAQYTLGFTEPNLLGRDLRFDIDLGYSEAESSFATYDSERLFFQPSLTFPIAENSNLQVRYTAEESEMLARDPVENGPVVGNEIAQGAQLASSLGYTYTFDSRLSGLNPNAGVLFSFGQDFAGLGGDSKYIKTTARAIAQTRVFNEEVTLRATFEAGSLNWRGDNASRTTDRFLLSTNIMRGFEPGGIGPRDISGTTNDPLGGNLYAVAKFEAEFPLGLPEELGIRGGLFYDIGNLWNLDDANLTGGNIVGEGGSARHVIGFSVFWTTPIGPLRFNFTNALSKEDFDEEQTFDFTLSTTF
ncbi:outer membrane protein assembly factor BamA [Thalassococcus sp. S3]|uniref:outer membrane protein assembly factor BamA n=1 Tax=Thalassococcus sp. S3 TaxID=2017482 RepID=UPI0010241ECE|nr:outer membrane protein assembly factor BamA [Thalassococcus sp. S3]QBF31687.1 outer membrane protein assembly factor BamA [Thalassococcus sp. S3]